MIKSQHVGDFSTFFFLSFEVMSMSVSLFPVLRIRTIFDWIWIRLLKMSDPDPVPDLDPDLSKFSDKFLLDIFWAEICSKT
jgi:hypothetical protein